MVTGPLTSNTRRNPLFGNLPERIAVIDAFAPRAVSTSGDDFATSRTTRPGSSNRKALCLAGADRSSTTRVPVSVAAMRTSRISAATSLPETPATDASSVSRARMDAPVSIPKKPFPIMEFNA